MHNTITNANSRKKHRRSVTLLISLLLVLAIAVGATLAYIITNSGPVNNTFNPGKVETKIDEKFTDKTVKKSVKIQNTGDTEVYIRVALVFTWVKEGAESDSTAYSTLPVEGTDYTITYGENVEINDKKPTDPKWVKFGDGYWYYTAPVAPGTQENPSCTAVLIEECKITENANIPDGYTLSVEVISQAIQADPVKAVTDSWRVSLTTKGTDDKTLYISGVTAQ